MNIEEYRAMKAEQERAKADAQTQRTGDEQAETQTTQVPKVPDATEQTDQPTPNSEVQEPSKADVDKPITVEIDGKEITLDELKNGYLRQSDYTKKTQEARRKEQQAEQALQLLEQLKSNPQVSQQLSEQLGFEMLDPKVAQYKELENRYYDLYIQNELRTLRDKYGDFEEGEVLEIAMNEKIENLDTAFHIMKSRKGGGATTPTLNVDEIKAQLREELMKELTSQQEANVDTSTIIQTGGDVSPVRDTSPALTPQEQKVARMMGLNADEYAKWRDVKKKK